MKKVAFVLLFLSVVVTVPYARGRKTCLDFSRDIYGNFASKNCAWPRQCCGITTVLCMDSCENLPCLRDLDCDSSRCHENGRCGPPNSATNHGNKSIVYPVFVILVALFLLP